MKINGTYVVVIFCFLSFLVNAQQVVINEIMPANSFTIPDEDGDFSDWIELFNTQDSSINLAGYGISDDSSNSFKWVLPELNLSPKDHFLIFASDKNRTTWINWETIIDWGDDWKYLLGTSEPPAQWKNVGFNDAAWSSGSSGFGYGDGDDSTIVPAVQSVYIRKIFNIEKINDITSAVLHVDYDDAFVAYLNGVEIARANIGTINIPPPYNQSAYEAREALIYQGGLPESFIISNFQNTLQQGENVIAIQVHNYGTNSSDMTLIPFLSLGMNTNPPNANGTNPLLQLPNRFLHANFKLDADGEGLFITNPQGIIEDSISTGVMLSDISFGRQPDGTGSWFYFDEPTPGDSNLTASYNGLATEPEFSLPGGFFSSPINVTLSNGSANVIRYTIDGSEPQESSTLYTQPVQINSTKVLRARSFSPGFIPSKTVTNTYLINFPTDLPVFSISTDPANFFDNEIGIYVLGDSAEPSYPYFGANFWKDWERPVHVELFDINDNGFNTDAGVKIYGAWSRAKPQKSLSIFARNRYGSSKIDYPLFPDLPYTEYESFVLRNSGNDWEYTMFRDGLMTSLVDGIDIDKPDFRAAILFLNGKYWGIHNLREKVNEDFIAAHHNVDRDSIDMLENFGVRVSGDSIEYMDLYNFIKNNNLSVAVNYQYVQSKMDINNFIAYHVSQIYFDNKDWPGNNIKFWKEKTNGKWRWIMFDTDFGFGLYDDNGFSYNTLNFALEPNGPEWPNPPWSTLFLRKLLANQTFKNDFINCAADLLNTNFLPGTVVQKINSMKEDIIAEIPRHINRWQPFDPLTWNNNVQKLINFANQRPNYLRLHIIQKFGLAGGAAAHITISDTSMGMVKLNSIEINAPDWAGTYFLGVPIQIIAKPKRGFRFVQWEGSVLTNEDSITITPNGAINLNAVFEIDTGFSVPKIVINEINYNSSSAFNPEDWIELYNNSDTSVNISGWVFKDSEEDHLFTITEGTVLGGREYLVLCNSDTLFHPLFPDVDNYIGNFDFGLSGSGELIRLFDADENIIDSLTFSDSSPWPEDADGNGPTLSLKNPNMENHLPESWAASLEYGTPGVINDVFVDVEEEANLIPTEYSLYQNYPNPFNPVTNIKYSIVKATDVSIKVYDILGNEIETLVNEFHKPGFYNIQFNASNLSSGVYFYRIIAENFISTKKLILLK
jgi:hypothetical protein